MKQRDQDFLLRLAERALPGSTRLVRAMGSLDKRIDELEKKVAGLDDTVDEQVSRLERGVDTLGEPRKQRTTQPEETSESGPN